MPIPTLKSCKFRPPAQKAKSIDLDSENKCFSARTRKQVNRDPRSKPKSFSIHTWKLNDYRSEHNTINFGPPHKNVTFDAQTKNKPFSTATQKTSQFKPLKSIPIPHTEVMSIWTTHNTPKSTSSLHWNQVKFDPSQWKQFNSNHAHKNQVLTLIETIFSRHSKTSQFRPSHEKLLVGNFRLPHWNQVNFDPAHKNQFGLHPIADITSISIPTLTSGRFRCPDTKIELMSMETLKTSLFRKPHKNQVNADPYAEIK